jgi:hypothetical protein
MAQIGGKKELTGRTHIDFEISGQRDQQSAVLKV